MSRKIAGHADDRFARYSMGMKQRLGVAAALIKDPDVLILDEPTNGLDPAGMADMRALIRRLGEEGRTVLLSSHQLGEVEQVCDRVGVIACGRLLAESTVAELRGSADLIVGVDRADIAARIATGLLGADAVRIADGKLHCTLEPAQIGGLNRALVRAEVEVSELRLEERSLEEVFLSMTTTKESDNRG